MLEGMSIIIIKNKNGRDDLDQRLCGSGGCWVYASMR